MKFLATRIDVARSHEAEASYVNAGAIVFGDGRISLHALPPFRSSFAQLSSDMERAASPRAFWAYLLERGISRFVNLSVPLELEADTRDAALEKAWAEWKRPGGVAAAT